MADAELTGAETGAVVDGSEVVDITQDDVITERMTVKDILLLQFDPVVILAVDQNNNPAGKVRFAQCKICGALLQRDAGVCLRHATTHRAR